MIPGTKVRMSLALKYKLESLCGLLGFHVNPDGSKPDSEQDCMGCSSAHAREFFGCVGEVIGPVDYNSYGENDPRKIGPEVDVCWQSSNLTYSYHPHDLIEIKGLL